MSGVVLDNQVKVALPSAVGELLGAVRTKLRRYSVLSGLLFCVSAAALVFWLTSGIDLGWFALQRLELPTGLRYIILAVMTGGGGWLLITRILVPLVRRHRDQELALLLERRFPQFQDRLVTTVESTAGYPGSGVLVEGMLRRTINQAGEVASLVSTDDVFNLKPLKKNSWMAGLLALSVLGCGVVQPGSLERWWNAFIRCDDSYHLRTTSLDFNVIAQPGDRRMSFQQTDNVLQYLHPRGADLELEMVVPDGKSEVGAPWVVPARVRVDVVRQDGTRSRTYVSSASSRTFRFILTRLQETVSIEVLAGDYRTPMPLLVNAVTPPAIDSMQVDCRFPEYTGWNQQRETRLPVLGSEFSLPMGTMFQLVAGSNKPLQSARIVSDLFELYGDKSSCQLIPREGYEASFASSEPLLSADGKTLIASFHLTAAKNHGNNDAADSSALIVPSNTSLRFFLHDEDDIISTSPESVRIRGIPDRPPVIATRTTGVSNSITRRAIIPVIGTIQDDYGLQSASFEFIVDDETKWRPRPFRVSMPEGVVEFALGDDDTARPERFDVRPLELTEGQTLALVVTATDRCTEPEPNTSRAEPVVFRIVSNEELLSLLYTRELNLRRRFEEVIQQMEQIRDDLTFHQDVAERIESADAASVKPEDRSGLTRCADLNSKALRRQNNELKAIVESFEEIIQQLINNAIPPVQLAENMSNTIVMPMQTASEGLMVRADRSISRFLVAATSGQPASKAVAESITDISNVITELKAILENVRDLAEFHEVLNDLSDILKDQQRIQKETNVEQIKNLGF